MEIIWLIIAGTVLAGGGFVAGMLYGKTAALKAGQLAADATKKAQGL